MANLDHFIGSLPYLQVNSPTLRFGNPTYLQPITTLSEGETTRPLLDQRKTEAKTRTVGAADVRAPAAAGNLCDGVSYVESYTIFM